MTVIIQAAHTDDSADIWDIVEPVIRAGETYALPRDMSRQEALAYFMGGDRETYVAVDESQLIGLYYLRANQQGGGSHVANCGYVVSEKASGRGVARMMCEHSLDRARARGFRAMQFNLVVSTNTRAVHLWMGMGFAVVGTLPKAFCHPRHGDVDALVMFRGL